MKGEVSTVSNSQTSDASSVRGFTSKGQQSRLSILYPLFERMNQRINLYPFIYYIAFIYLYLQIYIITIWPHDLFWSVDDHPAENIIIKYLMEIFWMEKLSDMPSVSIFEITVLVINIIAIIWFISIIVNYSKSKRFRDWSLYPCRFYMDVILPIFCIPCSAYCGSILEGINFFNSIGQLSTELIIYCVIGFFNFAIILIFLYISWILSYSTPYLHDHCYSTFDPKPLIRLIVVSSLLVLLQSIFRMYPSWSILILQICHAILSVFMGFSFLFFPFVHLISNTFVIALFTVSPINDLIMTLAYFFKADLIGQCVVFGLFILSFIGVTIGVHFYIKKTIQTIKSVVDDSSLSLQDFQETIVTDLHLDINTKALMKYLIVACRDKPSHFAYELKKFAIEKSNDEDILRLVVVLACYIPSESRLLNIAIKKYSQIWNIDFGGKFTIIQAVNVSTRRQSSSSFHATEALSNLSGMSARCRAVARSFWLAPPKVSYLSGLSSLLLETKATWIGAINNFPNSVVLNEEYAYFAAESLCDIDASLNYMYRSQMITCGTSFAKDQCFKLFVRAFPRYLKDKYIDTHGVMLNKSTQQRRSASSSTVDQQQNTSSSNSSYSSLSSSSSLIKDPEVEECISKQVLLQHKTRTVLYNALKTRKARSAVSVLITCFISIIISLVIFSAVVSLTNTYFSLNTQYMSIVWMMTASRYSSSMANWILHLGIAIMSKHYDIATANIGALEALDDPDRHVKYVNLAANISETMAYFSWTSSAELDALNALMGKLPSQGIEVIDVASYLFDRIGNLTKCIKGAPVGTEKANYPALLSYVALLQQYFGSLDDISNLFENDQMCELAKDFDSIVSLTSSQLNKFSLIIGDNYRNVKEQLDIISIAFPIIIFVVMVVPIFISLFCFYHEIRKHINAMHDFPETRKKQFCDPIIHHQIDNKDQSGRASSNVIIFWYLGYTLISVIIAFIMYIAMELFKQLNEDQRQNANYQQFTSIRFPYFVESLIHTINSVLLSGSNKLTSTFYKLNEEIIQAKTSIGYSVQTNMMFLVGTQYMQPCIGKDSELDNLNIMSHCPSDFNPVNDHDIYSCVSATSALSMFNTKMLEILDHLDKMNSRIDTEQMVELMHMANSHLLNPFLKTVERITEVTKNDFNKLNNTMTILLVIVIIFLLIEFYVAYIAHNKMNQAYDTLKGFILHIPPVNIINNQLLISILLDRTIDKKQNLGTSGNVIQTATDAILCVNSSGTIEIVNPAVNLALGYSPEQLLGQSISSIFIPANESVLNNVMQTMLNQQNSESKKKSSEIYEDNFTCVADDDHQLPTKVTILGMRGPSTNVESFVFIIRDETELRQQIEEAEHAKANSEKLLYQILPRDIVMKLNDGEKDISFTVPHASIIFIDIVKFSAYSQMLTPGEIMGNLSQIFAKFDLACQKYPLITKIKLIGDVYMAAAGLFGSPEEKDHAIQIINFGLDCIQAIEEINVLLESNLQVRVGVNTGGPLLAGVLGTDKPVFDIIGDPINVSSRLQSTDIPGNIQIPTSTYELIKDEEGFEINKRGEIFLKGKGKTITYIVTRRIHNINPLQ